MSGDEEQGKADEVGKSFILDLTKEFMAKGAKDCNSFEEFHDRVFKLLKKHGIETEQSLKFYGKAESSLKSAFTHLKAFKGSEKHLQEIQEKKFEGDSLEMKVEKFGNAISAFFMEIEKEINDAVARYKLNRLAHVMEQKTTIQLLSESCAEALNVVSDVKKGVVKDVKKAVKDPRGFAQKLLHPKKSEAGKDRGIG